MYWDDKIVGYPVIDGLLDNFDVVKKELLSYVNDKDVLFDYPNYTVAKNLTIYENYWKATPCTRYVDEHVEINGTEETKELLEYMIAKFRVNCPVTYSIIKHDEDIGVLCNSFISRLMPGSIINPHKGWTDKYMRIHLGLTTDPDCKMRVEGKTRAWEDGKILAFNDGDLHSVDHLGTKERIVFSFDVDKEYLKQYMRL